MLKKILFFSLLCTWACKNDNPKTNTSDNDLQEVRLDEKMKNSDIIRNPITANQPIDTVNVAKLTFQETKYNFGTVKAGTVVKKSFKFKNTGKVPLIITDVRSTCGCTVPEWNKKSIAVGAEDEIKINFDTEGKLNEQVKPVTIVANTFPAQTVVTVLGKVEKM